MKIYVIMLNDVPKYAVVGDKEKAKRVREEMRDKHYKLGGWAYQSRVEYNVDCRWLIRAVPGDLE